MRVFEFPEVRAEFQFDLKRRPDFFSMASVKRPDFFAAFSFRKDQARS